MDWELEMPCEIGRSLEYRISYTIYTRLSCLLLFLLYHELVFSFK